MGAVQCHGVVDPYYFGKAVSQDYLLSRPTTRYNEYGPQPPAYEPQRFYNGYNMMPTYAESALAQSPYATVPRSKSMRISGSRYRKIEHSCSTVSPESGFSSKASSNLDNTNHSASAPSTPEMMIRRKPPPKPPRMRSSTDTLLRTPTPSVRSVGVHTLKSSIVDVTNTLDSTLSCSFDDSSSFKQYSSSPMVQRYRVSGVTQEKVYNILSQTKEFLAFELEADGLLSYLTEKEVLDHHEVAEIKSCVTKQAKCEHLIDLITSKGHEEFMVFCDALRTVGSHGYLADFLEVLDTLVEIATSNIMKPVEHVTRSPNLRVRAFSFEGEKQCNMCSCNNNCDDDEPATFSTDSSFDIDISYMNRDTDASRSVREVAAMKRRKRPLSVASEDFALLEEADRYIPVISVNLYNQCLANGGIKTIASLLENYRCIRELSMVKNHMDAKSMEVLEQALTKNRGLAKLDMRLNYIGDDGALHLAHAISRHISLRTLKVTSTGLAGDGCSHLVKGVAKSPYLVELDIGFNDMTEHACEVLAKCLYANPPLRMLRLRCNAITPYGARCIFKGLKRNSRITYLDVSRNKIRDESISVLSDVLLSNRTLREINLENCNITGIGCVTLARALKSNTSLHSLDLSMNSIGDVGAKALSEGLKYNQTMETLCLNMCNIGNVGFLCILDALRHNITMSSLKLCYNSIGKQQESEQSSTLSNGSATHASSREREVPDIPVLTLLPAPMGSSPKGGSVGSNTELSSEAELTSLIPSSTHSDAESDSGCGLTLDMTHEITEPEITPISSVVVESKPVHSTPNGHLPQLTIPVHSPDYENLPCRLYPNQHRSPPPSPTFPIPPRSEAQPPSPQIAKPPRSQPLPPSPQISKPPRSLPLPPSPQISKPPRSQPPPPSSTVQLQINTSTSSSSLASLPQSFFSATPPTPRTPVSPLSWPRSPPISPLNPLTATLRQSFTAACSTTTDSVEQMYETLCEVLQQNKNLKVLLWGNNFDDEQEDLLINDGGLAQQIRTEP